MATVGTVSAVFGSLFGAAGAGVTGYKMSRRVGDVEEFYFVPLSPGQGLVATTSRRYVAR